jgi:hypothetical protein
MKGRATSITSGACLHAWTGPLITRVEGLAYEGAANACLAQARLTYLMGSVGTARPRS